MLSLILIPALLASDADEALATFRKAYRAREVTQRAAAVTELAKTEDRKVRTRLRKLLSSDLPPVRIAAARGLGATTRDKASAARDLAVATRANTKYPNVVLAIFEALGTLREESVVGELHRHFGARETPVAKSAIATSGTIGSGRSVPVLIPLLKKIEEIEKRPPDGDLPNGGLPGGFGRDLPGVGGNLPGGVIERGRDDADRRRALELGPIVRQALRDITGTDEKDARAWQTWWAKNRRTFKQKP